MIVHEIGKAKRCSNIIILGIRRWQASSRLWETWFDEPIRSNNLHHTTYTHTHLYWVQQYNNRGEDCENNKKEFFTSLAPVHGHQVSSFNIQEASMIIFIHLIKPPTMSTDGDADDDGDDFHYGPGSASLIVPLQFPHLNSLLPSSSTSFYWEAAQNQNQAVQNQSQERRGKYKNILPK